MSGDLTFKIDLATRNPVMRIETVAYLLQFERNGAVKSVEDGRLAWAWDLSATPGVTRRDLRVWRGSVAAWLNSQGRDGGAGVSYEDVLGDLIAHRDLRACEFRRRLGIHHSTVARFIKSGQLRLTSPPGSVPARISRDSIVRFLQTRRA